jgi:hypothetical protein
VADVSGRTSEVWKGTRRGAGWALGVGTVVSVAALLRDGPRQTLKAAMKAGLRGREVAAEMSEQVRDLYAEAQVEHATRPADRTVAP